MNFEMSSLYMSLEFIGFTLDVIGTIMVAYAVLMVHHRVSRERRVDGQVLRAMRHEQIVAIVGVMLIVIGYFLQLPGKF